MGLRVSSFVPKGGAPRSIATRITLSALILARSLACEGVTPKPNRHARAPAANTRNGALVVFEIACVFICLSPGFIKPVKRRCRRRHFLQRSEERRVGKESVSTCRSRGSPDHKT